MQFHTRGPLYLDIALYTASAAFAGYTAMWSTLPSHQFWGGIALGGYLPAAIISAMLLTRYAVPVVTRMWVSVAAVAAVVVMPLVAAVFERSNGVGGRAQEEVLVVEASGRRLVDTGSPYLTAGQIAEYPGGEQLLAYNPYQPGMAVFGLPRALSGSGWFGYARLWFALATLIAVVIALRLLTQESMSRPVWIRAVQAVGVLPICALTLATGGDDLPVLALCLLAFACAATDRPLGAGIAIGIAAALKLFAWPVLFVLLVFVVTQRSVVRFAPVALGIPILTLLAALPNWDGFVDNVIAFPTGNGLVESPAASPFPGYLIATYVPAGGIIALSVLGVTALVIAVYVVLRPPQYASSVAMYCAAGLLAAILLLPASRFGYLLYPTVFAVWWWVMAQTREPYNPWQIPRRLRFASSLRRPVI